MHPSVPAAPRSIDRKNLAVRGASALVFAIGFFTLLWFGEHLLAKTIFLVTLAVASWVGVREMVLMARKEGVNPSVALGTILAWLFLSHFFLGGGRFSAADPVPLWLVLVMGMGLVHLGSLIGYKDPIAHALSSQAITWMSGLVMGLGLGFQLKLFMFNQTTVSNTGARLILALYLIVWFGDTAAYFAGHLLGRRKLAPKVSPGKTWEGAVGNLVGNVGGAALAKAALICPNWSWVDVVAIGLLLGAVGILGDLAESTWKRSVGVKDSAMGIEIPGHGGVLDRMDSLLFAAPALYAYVSYVHGLS